MNITIKSVADLGLAVRAVRRSSKVRLDDLAVLAGVSKQFTSDVEYGKPTVQLGLVFKLLAELGILLQLDIPKDASAELMALQQQGGPRAPVDPAALGKRRSSSKTKRSLTAPTERPDPSEVMESSSNSTAAGAALKAKGGGDAQS